MANKRKCCISGENLNIAAVCAANILAKDLTVDEIALLSTFLSVISTALSMVAAARDLCQDEEVETPATFR